VAPIVGYWGFLTLRARKQFREVRKRKFYLLILKNGVFDNN
jgi:hypothetical protein